MEESERNFISEIKVIGIVGYPPPLKNSLPVPFFFSCQDFLKESAPPPTL